MEYLERLEQRVQWEPKAPKEKQANLEVWEHPDSKGRKAGWEIQALEAPLVSQVSREK